jgi:hypothetical protein
MISVEANRFLQFDARVGEVLCNEGLYGLIAQVGSLIFKERL